MVGATDRVAPQPRIPGGVREGRVPIGADEVGGLDDAHRPVRPPVEEGTFDGAVVVAHAVRRRGVVAEQLPADGPARHPAEAAHERADGRAEVDRRRRRGGVGLRAVAVRHHRAAVARVRELVAQRAGVGLVEQVGVGAVDACDAEVDQTVPGGCAGPLPVGGGRVAVPEPLRGRQPLAVGRLVARSTGPGADGDVRRAELGGLSIGAGGEVGDGGRIQEAREVRCVTAVEVAPGQRRHRDDENPVRARRRGRGRRRRQHDRGREHEHGGRADDERRRRAGRACGPVRMDCVWSFARLPMRGDIMAGGVVATWARWWPTGTGCER